MGIDSDARTADVLTEIQALMAAVRANVTALNAILTRPPDSDENTERLVSP